MKPEENIFHILAVQTTYKCNMLCANCYLGDMLNNPKFADVDPTKLEEVFKKLPILSPIILPALALPKSWYN